MTVAEKLRKKPIEIEAMKVTVDAAGWPSAVVAAWCGGHATNDEHGARIAIDTVYAYPGDYVIRGVVRRG